MPATAPRDLLLQCPHSGTCGGCPLIDRPYPDQLLFKKAKVEQAFARFSVLAGVAVAPVAAASPVSGYRTRAKLMVASGGRVGLFAKAGDHEVVDTPDCRVLRPELLRVAAVLRRAVVEDERGKAAPLSPFGAARGGALRAIDLREVTEGEKSRVLVTLVMQRELSPSADVLRKTATRLMQQCDSIVGFAVSYHEGESPQVLGSQPVSLVGLPQANDEIGDVRHLATFGSFVQAHRLQAARVHEQIRAAFDVRPETKKSLLDLYGGSGAIALSLASKGAKVRLVESFGPAVARAIDAGKGLAGEITATHGDVSVALREIKATGERFDGVVMNPPRRGVSPEARALIAGLGVARLVYVSCDPETLARDLAHFADEGYSATNAQPFDMIAQTEEVETLVVLERAEAPLPPVVFESEDLLVVAKSGHESTFSSAGPSLSTRIVKRPGCKGAVALNRLEHGTSGVVVFVKRQAELPRWTASVNEKGVTSEFIAGVRGVTHQKGTLRLRDKRGVNTLKFKRTSVLSGHSLLTASATSLVSLPLRKQLGSIGHPVLGDDKGHEPSNRFVEERYSLDRTFVHLSRVELTHPTTGELLAFDAPMPGDLAIVIARMTGSLGKRTSETPPSS